MEEQWHLSKSIPISIILFLIAQTVGLIIWGVKLDFRVGGLETSQTAQDVKISSLETAREKLIIIEERQNNVLRVLDSNAKKIDELVEFARKTKAQ